MFYDKLFIFCKLSIFLYFLSRSYIKILLKINFYKNESLFYNEIKRFYIVHYAIYYYLS